MTPIGRPSEPKIVKVPPRKSRLLKMKYQSSTLAEGLFFMSNSNTRCSKIRQKATKLKMNEINYANNKPYFFSESLTNKPTTFLVEICNWKRLASLKREHFSKPTHCHIQNKVVKWSVQEQSHHFPLISLVRMYF